MILIKWEDLGIRSTAVLCGRADRCLCTSTNWPLLEMAFSACPSTLERVYCRAGVGQTHSLIVFIPDPWIIRLLCKETAGALE